MRHPLLLPALLMASLPLVARAGDPVEDCYRENFPLALGIPQAAVPKQVRFYCAAPWDMGAMQSVRGALDKAGFDMLGATIRLSSSVPNSSGAKMAEMALQSADKGPPAMLGTMYRLYFALPMMHALHFQTSDAQFIKSRMHATDVAVLTTAAKAVDWNRPALQGGKPLSGSTHLKQGATLKEVAAFIMQPGSR